MPVDVVVREGILRITFTGTVIPSDIVQLGDAVLAAEKDLTPVPHRLTDLTAATDLNLSTTDLQALAWRRLAAQRPSRFKSAIVAPRPVHVGFSRMYQILVDSPQVDLRIFPDEAAALAWITEAE